MNYDEAKRWVFEQMDAITVYAYPMDGQTRTLMWTSKTLSTASLLDVQQLKIQCRSPDFDMVVKLIKDSPDFGSWMIDPYAKRFHIPGTDWLGWPYPMGI